MRTPPRTPTRLRRSLSLPLALNAASPVRIPPVHRIVAVLLLATLVVPLCTYLFLRESLDDNRYSYFYQWDEKALTRNEAIRLVHSEVLIDILSGGAVPRQNGLDHAKSNKTGLFFDVDESVEPDICFVVMAGAPRERKYLTQTVAFLLAHINPINASDARRVQLSIYSTLRPTDNATELSRLSRVVRVVSNNRTTEADARTTTWSAKLSLDRARAYRYADEAGCRFAVMVEDDAIAGRNLLETLTRAAEELERKKVEWGFVKLFYTEYWWGWSVDLRDIVQLVLMGVSAGLVLTLASSLILLPCLLPRKPPIVVHLVSFAYFTAFATLILWSVGKQTIFAPITRAPGLHLRTPDEVRAVGVAHLHPRRHLSSLASYLEERACDTCRETDNLADDWTFEAGVSRWELVPHVFQHIGVFSSWKAKNQGEFRWVKTSTAFYDDSVRLFGDGGVLL
ncbi:hypothetical protein M427DRAFT_57646 [Gonapodya prolifera JEL478]|uniref:Uncharacterized protein n=1 Tax=Gonapodya prolifera (strain JEL478) TaxID=1344416 RepID=A0A139ACH6_GONPJ|nr:hypothetical protein M427DRAFT_57646 [Gonapodya prolifera JEL478]|eukprot:KXS14477.1 hypothetical protein M427DRAFT_57646 [Gonapodya prolifera JEL478]